MVCKEEQELLGTWTLSPFLSPGLVWRPADQACLCPGDPVLDPLSQTVALVGVAQAALEGVALKSLVGRVLGGLVGVLVAEALMVEDAPSLEVGSYVDAPASDVAHPCHSLAGTKLRVDIWQLKTRYCRATQS